MKLKGLSFLIIINSMALLYGSSLMAGESFTCNDINGQTALECLVCNCFHESRGESQKGRIAVGKVVMTRYQMKAFPDTVCSVVYQGYTRKYSQFSWTTSEKKRKRNIANEDGFEECVDEMKEVEKFTGHYASHYHTTSVSPKWARRCSGKNQIGNHYFFTDCGGQERAASGTATSQ